MRHVLKALVLLVAIVPLTIEMPVSFAQGDKSTFGCDAVRGVCYFRIQGRNGGITNFQLEAGKREVVPDISPNSDRYCVCVDTPVPANWCSAPGRHCMGYVVIGSGYNNEVGTTPAAGGSVSKD